MILHKKKSAQKWVQILAFFVILFTLLCTSCHFNLSVSAETSPAIPHKSIIRVNVTRQDYNFHRPWQQMAPSTKTGIGVVIKGPRVLITAAHIANHRYIELEKIDTRKKSSAQVEFIDYEANLALLKAAEKDFLVDMKPLALISEAKQEDTLTIWQVKPNGNIIPSQSAITSTELAHYYYRNHFLIYRMQGSLQHRSGNFTLPVLKGKKLAGLAMRYYSKEQTIDVLAAPVIEHFLEDTADGKYLGFPLAGLQGVSTEDPQLRRYIGIADKDGGLYVESIIKGGAAERAGLKEGDVIFDIAGHPIDSHGNFQHPLYGSISHSHLVRCGFHVGDSLTYGVMRAGRNLTLDILLDHRPPEEFLVPPYVIDTSPHYFILGGLVLQELSTSYLEAYGKQWPLVAPIHLVYYEQNQNSLKNNNRGKIVFLSEVLPTSYTAGYETLSDLVVTQINNQIILRLEDVPLALKKPVSGFHKIEFEQRPEILYLDSTELSLINEEVRKRYNLPTLENLDLSEPK
ncbi:PDZ domain-containing protein [Thermodesulfobacteriota bacterium]